MSKETRIKEYQERIYKLKSEIDFCNEQIDELNGLTETCPHCKGEGRFMTIHRMFGQHSYTNCYVCRGKGKITIEEVIEYNKEHK